MGSVVGGGLGRVRVEVWVVGFGCGGVLVVWGRSGEVGRVGWDGVVEWCYCCS